MEKFKKIFANPDAQYRTAPLWVWNSRMDDSEIVKMLTELKNHGFGGAFVHPRPGMKLSYLDETFFERWKKALDTAKELGLILNIYDENSYPSGFGGGHVSAELPDCLSEAVRYQVFEEKDMDFTQEASDWLGNYDLINAFACDKVNGKMVFIKDLTQVPRNCWKGEGKYYAVMTHLSSQTAGWLAGFADIDRLRPEVTAMFLEKVYDQYAGHFGEEFGKGIQAIFTDEPSLPGSTVYGRGGQDSLPVNHWFAYEFRKRKHYDILKCIPSLFDDWEGVENEKIRHDYYQVVYELWVENFLVPIRDWSKKHHIHFTGHFMEDGWPKPYYCVVSPGVMSYYEYQDWPGIDLLLSGRLKEEPNEVQEISLIEVMSAAHQLGKERVFCEAFGAGGYDSELKDYKRMGDYLFVNGVNYINEHLSYTSYVGARKRDHPQSFDWRQAWWDDYTYLNDYFARLSAILSAGETKSRILVINPNLTGYLYPKKEDASQLVHNILAKEPNMRTFLQMINSLKKRQWDFHLGDEYLLQRHGKAIGDRLEMAKQTYETVILHECIKNMLPATLELLERFLQNGGKVLSVGRAGNFVSGRYDKAAYEQIFSYPGYRQFDTQEDLLHYLEEEYTPHFATEKPLPMGVRSLRRVLENGEEIFFLTNLSKEEVDDVGVFAGTYMEEWDPWSGKTEVVGIEEKDGKMKVFLSLKAGESKLYCVYHQRLYQEKSQAERLSQADFDPKVEVLWQSETIRAVDKNTWPLEYCDLIIDGETYEDHSVIAAGIKIFQKRGFQANPWDNIVQYKTRTYDRNRFYPENSGFSVIYRFSVEKGFLPEELLLCVEYGERYQIYVNDKPVSAERKDTFLDPLIRQYDIAALVEEGENKIVMTADRFDVELELEPVILRGEFGVYNRSSRWVMGEKQQLKEGSWINQGYPFYSGAVCYEQRVQYREGDRIFLSAENVDATAVSLNVNSKKAEVLNMNGIRQTEITRYLREGANVLQMNVCGSMKNLLGPHFDPEKPRRTAWPDMWKKAPVYHQPKAEDYDLVGYGLSRAVIAYKKHG